MPWRMTGLLAFAVLLAAGEGFSNGGTAAWFMRLSEFGFLAWFCWYGITRFVPRMQERSDQKVARLHGAFTQETAEARKHFSEVLDKLVARQEADRIATRDLLQEMIKHCAQQGTRIKEALSPPG